MKTITRLITVAVFGLGAIASRADLSLGQALNNTNLVWWTGGNTPWFPETSVTHDGLHAAQSGVTNDYDWCYLQTTITGKVAVTFWWKQSTATNYTGAHVYASGDAGFFTAGSLTGEQDWQMGAINFGGGTNSVEWTYNVPGPDRTNRNGNAAWVDQVTLTNIDHLKPVILAQPPGTLAVPDSYPINLSITVAAIGDTPMTYQWRHSETNLSDNGPFSGTATALLTIYNPSSTEAGDYSVVLSNQWDVVTSAVCTVIVVPSVPYIDPTEPADVVVAPDNWYYVSAWNIYGTTPHFCQWLSNSIPIPFETNDWHWFPAMNASYSLVVSNAVGVVTSRVAQVTVSTDPPMLLDGPNPTWQIADPGTWVNFWVDGTGPQPLNYNWYKVGDNNSVATWTSLSFTADPANTGIYYVILNNPNGSVTSSVCVLAVTPADPIGVAIDAPELAIDNGTWPYWSVDVAGTNAHDGLCAARSGSINNYESVPFSAMVQGPTNLTFWWRIDAGAQAYLDLSVDGGPTVAEISGQTDWQQQALTLADGAHTLTWTFRKDDDDSVGQDAAWVDQLVLGGTITNTLIFTTGGVANWYLETTNTHTLPDAWQSGAIASGPPPGTAKSTWLTTTVTGPGTISFWWQVASFGWLDFSMDGEPPLTETNGFNNWTYQSFPVGSGSHTLTWTYTQSFIGPGANAAWVDDVIFTPSAPSVVYFADANLEAAVRNALGIPSDPITPDDMLLLTGLDAYWDYITDLTGLEYAINLQYLNLGGNYTLTNLTALAGLTDLTSLELDNCSFTNLTLLAGLQNLQYLNLKENNLASLAGFPALTNLSQLDVGYNQISDITALTNQISLFYLLANGNQISDLHPLAVLPYLSELDVSYNQVGNASGLSLLHNVGYLDAGNNQISDVSFVAGMNNLQNLHLNSNPITNALPLTNGLFIFELDLSDTQVRDVSFAPKMTSLTYLYLSDDPITNHAALSSATHLRGLYVSQSGLRDLAALTGLTNLTDLIVDYNPITNYCPVSALRQLNSLAMQYDGLTDISCLAGLTNLYNLYLAGNALTSVPDLAALSNLEYLDLSYNQLQNVNGLATLTNLYTLVLSYNQLQDLNALSGASQLRNFYAVSNNLQNISGLLTCSNLSYVRLGQNLLNTSSGSPAMSVISALQGRGTYVDYSQQRGTLLPVLSAPQWLGGGLFRFTVTGPAGAQLDLLATADFVNWIPLGTATNVTGTDSFTVPATNLPAWYYRVWQH